RHRDTPGRADLHSGHRRRSLEDRAVVTFAVGLVAGVVATVLVALLVFKARVIAGTAKTRMPDLRMAIAVAALIVAIVALVRSGHTSDTRSTNPAPTDSSDSPSTAPAPSSSVSPAGASSTTSTVFRTVTVPNVTGLS